MNILRNTALVLFLAASSAMAQNAPSVSIAGQVQHPQSLSLEDLQKLPAATLSVSFQTDAGPEAATYKGVLLWTVISGAGLVNAPGKNANLRHTFLVTARDNYAAALSDGELDPRYEGKSVLLAYEKDGKPLDYIRLVVPGDHHGSRAVRDVVRIDVQ